MPNQQSLPMKITPNHRAILPPLEMKALNRETRILQMPRHLLHKSRKLLLEMPRQKVPPQVANLTNFQIV